MWETVMNPVLQNVILVKNLSYHSCTWLQRYVMLANVSPSSVRCLSCDDILKTKQGRSIVTVEQY